MHLSTLEIGAAQLLCVKSFLMCEQKGYLVTACDLKCVRVSEGYWLVSTLSVKINTPPPPLQKKKKKKTRKKGKKKTLKKTSSAEIFANNK